MNQTILFFEKQPFMGVELLDLLPQNYTLLSYDNDGSYALLKKQHNRILTYDNHYSDNLLSGQAISRILSDKQFIKTVIAKIGKPVVLFFFMNDKLNNLCLRNKLDLALPPYTIQQKFGSKLRLLDICSGLDIKTYTTLVFNPNFNNQRIAYQQCRDKLGAPFIIQGKFGVSGEDTYLITNYEQFIQLSQRLKNSFRASEYLDDTIPLSVHICITRSEILYEGPFVQLVGFKALTLNPFQFSGNDTNQLILNDWVKEKTISLSKRIAKFGRSLGYKGIFGIDFLWSQNTKKIFVQEINSRLVGLTRLLTGIQKEQKITPHLIRHINEFIPISCKSKFINKRVDLAKKNYSQLYISNNKKIKVHIKKYLLPGIYKLASSKLIKTKDSLFVKDMEDDEILVNYAAHPNSSLETNQIIAKIILKSSVLDRNQYVLSRNTLNLLSTIRNICCT